MMPAHKKMPEQIPFDLGGRRALGREDFLIGRCNQDAVAWVDRWPDWPAPSLILSGPSASGKTHLAAVWQEKSGAAVIRPENLLRHSAEEIAQVGPHLILDGIDPWLGDRAAEETIFHLYNMFKEEKRSILITMRMTPTNTDFAVPDLASRLRAAPLACIHPPDDMVLASVLIKLFSDRQLQVGNDVIKYILPRMGRSFADAREVVETADHMALAAKQKVSVPLMRKVLSALQGD